MIPYKVFFFDPDFEHLDTPFVEGYSNMLREANEPSLWKLAETERAHEYRFFFGEALARNGPVLIRLSIQPDGRAIATIFIWKLVPDDPNVHNLKYHEVLWIRKTVSVSRRKIKKLFTQLEKMNFWQLPTDYSELGIPGDGSTWYIEAVKDSKYHFVGRFSPRDEPISDLGILFMHVANLKGWERHIRYISDRNSNLYRLIYWIIDRIAWILARLLPPYQT